MVYEIIFYDHGKNGSIRNSKNKQVLEQELPGSGLELTLHQVDCMKDIPVSSSPKAGCQKGLDALMIEDTLAYAIIINSSADNFNEALKAAKDGCDLHDVDYRRIIVIGNATNSDGYKVLKTKASNGYLDRAEAKQLVGMLKAFQPT